MKKFLFILIVTCVVGYFLHNAEVANKIPAAPAQDGLAKDGDVPPPVAAENVAATSPAEKASPLSAIISPIKEFFSSTDKPTPGNSASSTKDPIKYVTDAFDNHNQNTITGCILKDESGADTDFGQVLAANSGRILILHVNNSNRQHCPRGDDKSHFNAVTELKRAYGENVEVIGINVMSPPQSIPAFKSYYGLNYAVYSVPDNNPVLDSDKAIEQLKNKYCFCKSIGNGQDRKGLNLCYSMPAVFLVKGGNRIVKRIYGLSEYDELDRAVKEALAHT